MSRKKLSLFARQFSRLKKKSARDILDEKAAPSYSSLIEDKSQETLASDDEDDKQIMDMSHSATALGTNYYRNRTFHTSNRHST